MKNVVGRISWVNVGAMLIALAVNLVGPVLVAREFAAAHDSSALEGAYYVGALIGQPVALLTLGFEFLFLGLVWPNDPRHPGAFAWSAVFAALPAIALMAWPQIGLLGILTSLFAFLIPSTAGWVLCLIVGTVALGAAVYGLALRIGRRASRPQRLGAAVVAALTLPFATALVTSPLWFSPLFHGTWYALGAAHVVPKEAQAGQTLSGPLFGSPCGVAANGRFLGMYIVSDGPPILVRSNEVSGNNSAQVPVAPMALVAPCGVATDWAGDVFVADRGAAQIVVMRDDGYGSFVPRGTIAGPVTALNHPRRIALDGRRNLYVLSQNAILVFRRGARGNVRPMRTLSGPSLGLDACTGFAVDKAGEIFVKSCGNGHGAGAYIAIFAPGADGNAKPARVITGPHTTMSATTPLTVDPRGDVVTLTDDQDVVAYSAGAKGDATPQRLLDGPLGLSEPVDLSLGGDGVPSLFIADRGRRTMTIFGIGTGPLALEQDSAMEPLSP